jgi:hypothetical protein
MRNPIEQNDHGLLIAIRDENRLFISSVMSRMENLERLVIIKMQIDDRLLQQVVDAFDVALDALAGDTTALSNKDATIADLTTKLAPNPELLAKVNGVLAKALQATPGGQQPPTEQQPPPPDEAATGTPEVQPV